MPSQVQIEQYRKRTQRMNTQRFLAANAIALISHTLTQPIDLVKMRSIMLQQGKTYQGYGFNRGYSPIAIFNQIHQAGGGIRKFYCSLHTFFLRTITYTTARTGCFLYFYDKFVHDPRRNSRYDFFVMAQLLGGMIAGFLTNPFQLIYTRMQADELYPNHIRWNYKNFFEAFQRVTAEKVLFRGAISNGLRIGGLCSMMTGIHDYMKEQMYFIFGPIMLNRFVATTLAVGAGVALSHPFDTIRTRMHIMRPLPNGQMPYKNDFDCGIKIVRFESSYWKMNHLGSFYAGSVAAYGRLFILAYISQYILDAYHKSFLMDELWHCPTYYSRGGIALLPDSPWSAIGETLVDNSMSLPDLPDLAVDDQYTTQVQTV